jgi:hypothetical protein
MVISRIMCCFAECFNNMARGWEIRVSDTEVDNIHPAPDLRGFHLIDPGKEIRGKLPHTFRVHAGYNLFRMFFKVTSGGEGDQEVKVTQGRGSVPE